MQLQKQSRNTCTFQQTIRYRECVHIKSATGTDLVPVLLLGCVASAADHQRAPQAFGDVLMPETYFSACRNHKRQRALLLFRWFVLSIQNCFQ